MAELGGTPIPAKISKLFSDISEDPDAVRKAGVDLATKLCTELISMQVPGLHFYTMNTALATLEIYNNLGLPSRG
jgi:methylenetetrahydrofolate reductase (NADPH)